MRQFSINNNIVRILIDTGTKVSVCGVKQTKIWSLLNNYNLRKPKHTLTIRNRFQLKEQLFVALHTKFAQS